jgi:hypothetical protein
MRQILKSNFIAHIDWLLAFFYKLVMGQLKALPGKPLLRCCIEDFLKIPFKGGQASSRQIAKLFNRHIEHKIFLHKTLQFDFARFFKISQHIINLRMNGAQDGNGFIDF